MLYVQYQIWWSQSIVESKIDLTRFFSVQAPNFLSFIYLILYGYRSCSCAHTLLSLHLRHSNFQILVRFNKNCLYGMQRNNTTLLGNIRCVRVPCLNYIEETDRIPQLIINTSDCNSCPCILGHSTSDIHWRITDTW